MTHALKCWPEYFADIQSGKKLFELRKDDRPFQVGDKVIIQEYDTTDGSYSGQELSFEIGYILRDAPKMGLKPGYCILQLSTPTEKPKE